MSNKKTLEILDPLYGDIQFGQALSLLIKQPLLQRLRHVRLSNIDSFHMTGIAGITRFEHAIGTAHLASQVAFAMCMPEEDRTLLQAAALIHDSAITPYGHLVEEALQYVAANFDHEDKWSLLMSGTQSEFDIGGLGLQLYLGQRSGLQEWASETFGGDCSAKLRELLDAIHGCGRFGPCIAGSLDLDNIDNVTRMAFHMGLRPDVSLPTRLCSSMVGLSPDGEMVFDEEALTDIHLWSEMRYAVYNRLMPSSSDLVGKIMLLASTVAAMENEDLYAGSSWKLTDAEFLNTLQGSEHPMVRETANRWMLGEVWELAEPIWLTGPVPTLAKVLQMATSLSDTLGRSCFAYRIKDKRNRELKIRFGDGTRANVGAASSKWLLAIASPVRRDFNVSEKRRIINAVLEYFPESSLLPANGKDGLF